MAYYKTELSHHGIRGQKWGVRRYQNPDGTLTEEGQERYRKGDARDYISKGGAQRGAARVLGASAVTNLATGILAGNAYTEATYAVTAAALQAIAGVTLGSGVVAAAAAIGLGAAAIANRKIGEAKYKDLAVRYKQASKKNK